MLDHGPVPALEPQFHHLWTRMVAPFPGGCAGSLRRTVKGEAECVLGDALPLSSLLIFPSKQLTSKNKTE